MQLHVRRVLQQRHRVLGESMLLAMIGGILGLGLAAFFILFVRDSVSNVVPKLTISLPLTLTGIALMLGLGIVTGLLPALNAMRLKIAAALGRS